MDDSRTHPTVSTEKTEKDSAPHLKKDVQKKAEPSSSKEDPEQESEITYPDAGSDRFPHLPLPLPLQCAY